MSNNFLCELCCPNCNNLGELIPGYFLINLKDSKRYAIISESTQGHWNFNLITESIYIWDIKPEVEIVEDESNDWILQFDYIEPHLNNKLFTPIEGYNLISSCITLGYNPDKDGDIEWWLFFKAGRHIHINNYNEF